MAMKYILFLLFAVVLCASCEDLEDNSPTMQGTINYDFFKANDVRAEKYEDGSVTMEGYTQNEILTLHISNTELGTYELGVGASYASFEDINGNIYSTSPIGSGEIVLSDSCISCGWLTGTFNFEAILPDVDTITVHRGIFHKANFLEGGLIDEGQINVGTLIAIVDGNDYEAVIVSANIIGSSLVIEGSIDNRIIRIEVPSNANSGNFPLPIDGYNAVYTDENDIEEQATDGFITVNFHNIDTNRILIFFHFITASHVIGQGRADISY